MSEVVSNKNVWFLWEIAAAKLSDDKYSLELLQEVVNIWVTMRGFSVLLLAISLSSTRNLQR